MEVGADHRGLFLRIPRTASTSIEEILKVHPHVVLNSRDSILPRDDYLNTWSRRGLAKLWRQTLGGEAWKRLYTFAFVRDPYDRALSSWRYAARRLATGDLIAEAPLLQEMKLAPVGGSKEFSFDAYLELLEHDELIGQAKWHSTQQAPHVINEDGEIDVDFVGRFETLQQDFDTVCGRLDIPRGVLPMLNRSARTDRRSLEKMNRSRRRSVERIYACDLELFGYNAR
jgi:hypothetical protein